MVASSFLQSSKFQYSACWPSTNRPERFRMNLLWLNVPAFKICLYSGHKTGRATEKVVRVDIVDQAGKKRAVDTSLAVVVNADDIVRAGATISDMHVDIRSL